VIISANGTGTLAMNKHAIVVLSALALSGCESTAKRQCAGFGTPLTEKWYTGRNIGDVINYANDSGATIALELTVREDSEPYEGLNPKADNVKCESNSNRQYDFENSDVTLVFEHEHLEFDPSWNRPSLFDINLRSEPTLGNRYSFALDVQSRQEQYTDTFNPAPETSILNNNVQIGNNQYSYAIEQKLLDLSRLIDAANADPFANIVRVIMAEGGGLVQFELLNGEVYSRI